jgi:hypothetical protein
MSVLLASDRGRVAVTDEDGVALGVLDADGVHRQLRNSVRTGRP